MLQVRGGEFGEVVVRGGAEEGEGGGGHGRERENSTAREEDEGW